MKHVESADFNCYNDKCKKEFIHILGWLKEWGCSRTVGLGTKLPWDTQFVVESLSDSTIYMAYYTVAHILQGENNLNGQKPGPMGVKAEAMNEAAWDYVFLGKGFDGAAIPGISEVVLATMRHEFEFWYPMDMRTSGKDLIRNHLTMSLYNHTAIWDDPKKWTRSYFCNGWLNLNNEKMSKSTGNFKTLREIMDTFGVNAMRIALADAGDGLDDANFDTETANQAILKLCTLENWMQKNIEKLFEGVEYLDFSEGSDLTNPAKFDNWDKIFLSKVN
jgi:leucyl-tRNA synthetase